MAKIVPVLDSNGWVTDLPIKADEALCNIYITLRSQSDAYRGQLVSLADMIRQFGNNPRALVDKVQETLQGYFDRQFEEANLKVSASENGPSIDLQIDAILRDGTEQITLVHAVTYTNSKIQSIIDLQNNGKEIIPADMFS
jgi:hypothetical protein